GTGSPRTYGIPLNSSPGSGTVQDEPDYFAPARRTTMLPSVQTMTDDEYLTHVRTAAKMFAFRHHLRADPGGDEEAAHAYAARYWKRHTETALDFLAMCEADREAHEQAPLN